jgi:5-carboxymethyl-2-hydroxymuconate isomerase
MRNKQEKTHSMYFKIEIGRDRERERGFVESMTKLLADVGQVGEESLHTF